MGNQNNGNINADRLLKDAMEALGSTPNGASAAKNLDKLSAILHSPDGQRLLALLLMNGNNNDSLKSAANKAASGDTAPVKGILSDLMQSDEGKALLSRLMSRLS